MSKFKVGDKVRINTDYYTQGVFDGTKVYSITEIMRVGGTFYSCILDASPIIVVPSYALIPVSDDTETTQSSDNNGGKTDYYQLPDWVKDADDFAEWRGMDFFQGNILKSVWCFNTNRHSGTNEERELNKIIHYAQKRLNKIRKER